MDGCHSGQTSHCGCMEVMVDRQVIMDGCKSQWTDRSHSQWTEVTEGVLDMLPWAQS